MKIFILVNFIIFSACNSRQEEVTRPVVQDITESVYASGIVKSYNQYQVFSPVNGIISQKLADEGDTVNKGDVIMKLVNQTPELSFENARLAATYSSVPYNADKLNELKLSIDLARSKMKNDSALLQRQNNLWKEGIGSRNELEQRELSYKNAVTTYQAALLQYNSMQKQIGFAAQQSVKNLQISKAIKNDYSITALQHGKVYTILKEPGEMVNTQTPVAIIGDIERFVIVLQIDEYDIGKIRTGQKVFLSFDTYQGQVFEAIVTKIRPIMNERSKSFEVEASFTSPPPHLYPNLTVEANILISTKQNALTIPRACLVGDSQVVLKNGKIIKVVTGLKDYQRVEIIKGLTKNDYIKLAPE